MPIPVLTVFKIVAYHDRPAERERDLADLAYILMEYDPEDRFSNEVIELGLSYEGAGPFLLSRKISEIINEIERVETERFVKDASDEDDPSGVQAKVLALGPPSWKRDPEELEWSHRSAVTQLSPAMLIERTSSDRCMGATPCAAPTAAAKFAPMRRYRRD